MKSQFIVLLGGLLLLVACGGPVATHVGNLLGKLALASRTEAAVWIWRHGLTEGTALSGGNQPEKDG